MMAEDQEESENVVGATRLVRPHVRALGFLSLPLVPLSTLSFLPGDTIPLKNALPENALPLL